MEYADVVDLTIPSPPVTFAWVNSWETTFLPEHIRMDEDVTDFEMNHSEGNAPTNAVTIKNPYRGWVGPGHKYWIWMALFNKYTAEITPFFFGRLIASPDNIQDETVTLQFMARSTVWLKLKQHQADMLRNDPYDNVLVNVNSRADPDAVLNFRSALWHFDRIPVATHGKPPDLQVGISDILIPENGWLTFMQGDHFYKAFNWKIGQQPLSTVEMRSDVKWIQTSAGIVDVPTGNVAVWTGSSIVSGWPKPGTGLSGGYTVAYGTAFSGTEYATATDHHFTYENTAKQHKPGDVMTEDAEWTTWSCSGDLIQYQVLKQPGIIESALPYSYDQNGFLPGFPDPQNIPLHVQYSELLVCFWYVNTTLGLEFDVQRPRHEKVQIRLDAQLQPVFTDVHQPASEISETMNQPGADVGLPIINTQSWYTLEMAGNFVEPGTYVVSTPEAIGGPYYAVAIRGGYVGAFEPAWTLDLGQIITDGSVEWAMVGSTIPTDFPTWRDVSGSTVSAGLVIRAQFYLPPPVDIFGHPLVAPPAGTQSIQVAINNGTTQVYSNGLNGVADLHPSWPEPRFSAVQGQETTDNTVVWLSLGTGGPSTITGGAGGEFGQPRPSPPPTTVYNSVIDIPLGLNPGANSYFVTDRGQRTIRALLNMMRAKLLMRSRIVKITFQCEIEKALTMDCKTGVIIYDHRIPDGVAFAKITSYTMRMNGDKTEAVAEVVAEASVGFGNIGLPSPPLESPASPIIVPGEGVYALPGYMQPSYQQMTGSTVAPVPPATPVPPSAATFDIGYTPPSQSSVLDDGITFPITDARQIIVNLQWITGTPPGAPLYVPNAVFTVQWKSMDRYGNVSEGAILLPVPNGYTPVTVTQQVTNNISGATSDQTTIYYYPVTQLYLELQNLNKPFSNIFFIDTTPLVVPEMVDTQAPSSP